jgi:6-phosphofructokinase 1
VNTAVDAIDKIRDTATSHERVFIVEVMGREHGFLALEVGLVCGAEVILIPEVKYDIKKVIKSIHDGHHRGKLSSIIVKAEGAGKVDEILKAFNQESDLDVRVSVLGYIQRGGSPTAISRMLACGAGEEAVELLLNGKPNRMIAMVNGQIASFPISEVLRHKKKINMRLYKLVEKLAI